MINHHKQAKIDLIGTLKRFNLPYTFDDFKQSCERAYNLPKNGLENFTISYIDDEEDKVIISNDFDYAQAILFINNPNIHHLRINLEPRNPHFDLTNINITDSVQLNENLDDISRNLIQHDSSNREGENILEFDDLQEEIDIQKQKLEEEKLKTVLEGVRESHYNIIESFNSNKDNKEDIKEKNEAGEKLGIVIEERKESFDDLGLESEQQIAQNDRITDHLKPKEIKEEKKINYDATAEEIHQQEIKEPDVKIEGNEERDSNFSQGDINLTESQFITQQIQEEIQKEKRKLTVLERIRKKALDDLLNKCIPNKSDISVKKPDNIPKLESEPKETLVKEQISIPNNDEEPKEKLGTINIEIPIVEPDCREEFSDKIEVKKESNNESNNMAEDNKAENGKIEINIIEPNNYDKSFTENIPYKKVKNKKFCKLSKSRADSQLDKSFYGETDQVESDLKERIVSTIKTFEKKFNEFRENMTNKIVKKTNKIIDKYIEYKNKHKKKEEVVNSIKQEIQPPKKEPVIHEDVRCDKCYTKPIVGDRYKCSICENYDFCEKCEEENFSKQDKHSHPFIRIRHPSLSPDLVNSKDNLVNLPLQINIKNSNNNIELANSNIFIGTGSYSSECLNVDMEVNHELESSEIPKILLTLKNNGSISWPKPCFLGCLKEKSTITCLTIPVASKMNPNSEINLEVKISLPEGDNLKVGKYLCYLQLYHSSSKNYFGEEFCVVVYIKDPEYLSIYNKMSKKEQTNYTKMIKSMRDSYQISPDVIDTKAILKALIKENCNKEKALMLLLENQ